MFERWRRKQEAQPTELDSKLVRVISDISKSKDVFNFVTAEIFDRAEGQFASVDDVKSQFIGATDKTKAFHLARLIDSTLGAGTFRKLAFVSSGVDAPKNVLKIIRKDLDNSNFEKQVERGYYMGVMENYDIQWSFDKTARDAWQNFFDANGQTLDNIESSVAIQKAGEQEGNETTHITIAGKQTYDWLELAHIGATTNASSVHTAMVEGESNKNASGVQSWVRLYTLLTTINRLHILAINYVELDEYTRRLIIDVLLVRRLRGRAKRGFLIAHFVRYRCEPTNKTCPQPPGAITTGRRANSANKNHYLLDSQNSLILISYERAYQKFKNFEKHGISRIPLERTPMRLEFNYPRNIRRYSMNIRGIIRHNE